MCFGKIVNVYMFQLLFSIIWIVVLTRGENASFCGEIYIQHCVSSNSTVNCRNIQYFPNNEITPEKIPAGFDNPITKKIPVKINISNSCRMSLCQHKNNMGRCLQISKVHNLTYLKMFNGSFPNSILCSCVSFTRKGVWNGDEYFDRNFFGVEYSPFDKHMDITSFLGDKVKQLEFLYTKEEVRAGLENVVNKFTNIIINASFGPTVPTTAAEINKNLNFPAIRIILRTEMVNTTQATVKLATQVNKIFPGTVWAIVIKQTYTKAKNHVGQDVIREILKSRNISSDLKFEFQLPIDSFDTLAPFVNLSESVRKVDFVFISTLSFEQQDCEKSHQNQTDIMVNMYDIKTILEKMNPSLIIMYLAGQPGLSSNKNSLKEFQNFWYSNTKFASESLVFMFEAVDQPFRNLENGINDSNYGWWQRKGDSVPPVYFEKVSLFDQKRENVAIGTVTESFLTSTKLVVGGCLTFLGIILSMAIYFRRKLQQERKNKLSKEEVQAFQVGREEKMDEDNYAVVLNRPYDRKYELEKYSFVINETTMIGSGQSGVVFCGRIKDIQVPVAFKCTTYSSSVTDVKQLLSEIKILSYLGIHENILCLLGAYTKKIQKGIVYVALEYCALGSLESFLRKLDPNQLFLKKVPGAQESQNGGIRYVRIANLEEEGSYIPHEKLAQYSNQMDDPDHDSVGFETFLTWSYQIACGMEFLSKKGIVHADLSSRNVLLASTDNIKISDFGLSRKLYQDVDISNIDDNTPLPWRWMAPESLRNLVFSVETDVWSFGVTIWEIFSLAEVPYHGLSYNLNFVERLEQGLRLQCAKFGNDLIHEKLLPCWNLAAAERPSFLDLKETFRQLICELCANSTAL